MKIYKKFLNIIYSIWNKMAKMIRKQNLTEEQKEMLEELKKQLTVREINEYLLSSENDKPSKKDRFFRNIFVFFVFISIIMILSIAISAIEGEVNKFVILWLRFGFPIFCLIGTDFLTYKYQKSAYYYRTIIVMTLLYVIIAVSISIYSLHHFNIFLSYLSFDEISINYLFLIGIYFILSPLIKEKFFSKDIIVKEFDFFQTKYKIEEIIDIIENVLWNSSHVKSIKRVFENENGHVYLIDRITLFSLSFIDKCFSITVSIESGKYILQDEETKSIQNILKIIYLEIPKFKELKETSIRNQLDKKHRTLLFQYVGTPIFSISYIKEKKWIFIIASAVIIGIFLLTEVSKEEQIKYLIMIWLSCLSLIFAYWANKNKH